MISSSVFLSVSLDFMCTARFLLQMIFKYKISSSSHGNYRDMAILQSVSDILDKTSAVCLLEDVCVCERSSIPLSGLASSLSAPVSRVTVM